jgi:hypothetical protein
LDRQGANIKRNRRKTMTAAEPRSNRKGRRLFWRDRSEGPSDDSDVQRRWHECRVSEAVVPTRRRNEYEQP